MEHQLKTIQPFFNDLSGVGKNFEIRKNDRNFKVGDVLILSEYDGKHLTGIFLKASITYILKDCEKFGLKDGFVILGLYFH